MYDSQSIEFNSAIDGLWNTCPQTTITGGSLELFLTLMNALSLAKCNLATEKTYPENIASTLFDNQKFDFIVVGSGSAGSVVANRLSENPDWKVLLLEAGNYPSTTSEIPNLFFSLQLTGEDWQYTTQPSDYCLGMKNKMCRWPRGKVLGGTSAINAMIYTRGTKLDYDAWAEMGNKEWDYDSVYPYFLKSENVQDPILKNNGRHAEGGYLTTSRAIFDGPLTDVITTGVKELGYDLYDDETALGYFHTLTTIENGTRCSSSKAFLSKINRKNLYLATNAFVKKVIIDRKTKTARGVVVTIDEQDKTIYAKKETILSGGSINSPQLLMLSGVGPSKHLEKLDIDVVQDLPVGENMKDHLMVPTMFIPLPKALYEPKALVQEVFDYLLHKKGSLGTIGISNLIGFVNTKSINAEYPDVKLHHLIFDSREQWVLFMESVGYVDEIINSDLKFPAMQIWPTVIRPKSMGKILLSSNDSSKKPLIYPNMFTDKNNEDLETMLRGIKYVMKLVETKPFKEHNLEISKHNIPNCDHLEFKTDDYWRCAIRNMASTKYHPVSTCKMGLVTDKTSVVNSKLQVHGVKNLRVIDSSIMPDITSLNNNGPTIMIGERGADFIKNDWGKIVT